MKDRLEKFVQDNREEFDVFEPRPELWQQICRDLPQKSPEKKEAKVIKFSFGERASFSADYFFMRVAAAVVLLLGCGLIIFLMKQQTPESAYTLASTEERTETQAPELASIAPELPEIEAYYVSQIEAKKSQLSEYDLKVLGLDEQQVIDNELAQLDSSYTALKKQLYTSPNTEEIVNAMVQNLWIRVRVLNKQLEVLQRLQKMNKETDDKQQTHDSSNV